MAVFCLLCGKRFQAQSALQQHMEVHAGVRSYICSECNRTFPSHTALKRHLRSHTGRPAATRGPGSLGTSVWIHRHKQSAGQNEPSALLCSKMGLGWGMVSVVQIMIDSSPHPA